MLSTYDVTSGTRSGGLMKGQSPCELFGGLPGYLSHRCRGLRPCEESVPEPEDSTPVLTWILGYFCSLPRGVSPRLEWGPARALSSRAAAAMSRFHSHRSRDLRLSLEVFPRGVLSSKSRKRGSSGCGHNCRASSRVETGMSGNFLSCSKGVKDPLEVPEVRCD